MDFHEALQVFGLPQSDVFEKLSPDHEVYRVKACNRKAVLKPTRTPLLEARSLGHWLRQTQNRGTAVNPPMELGADNPVGDHRQCWVLYPYLKGRTPGPAAADYQACGALLGELWSSPVHPGLTDYNWPEHEDYQAATIEDIELLKQHASLRSDHLDALQRLAGRAESILHQLQHSNLPTAPAVWDYKALNVLFCKERATLIDADSVAVLPRVLDLALAYLLWPNDCETLPGRLPNPAEWKAFREGLESQTELSAQEIEAFPLALEHMFVEEALWLLAHDAQGYTNARQNAYLLDLLDFGCFRMQDFQP